MRKPRFTIYLLLFAVLFSADAISAQTETFSDPNVEYTFEVPDPRWKMTVKPSATSPNVEYVFTDRNDGHLEVRKLSPTKNAQLTDVIRDEEQKLRFLQGYVAGREETFRGKLNGTVFNFEFVRAGRAMSGRFYFLRAGDDVYLLRFTGHRDSLRTIRTFTDIIGRTFSAG